MNRGEIHTVPLQLSQLALLIPGASIGGADIRVQGFCQDSRRVTPGALFGVRDGQKHRGVEYLRAANEAGAAAFLLGSGSDAEQEVVKHGLSHLSVPDVESAFGIAAQASFGSPSQRLQVVGVTGTNGKTTTVSLLRQGLAALGKQSAQLGTLGYESDTLSIDTGLTTPGPELIAEYMARAAADGCEYFAMEVSSHAAVQQRIAGVRFAGVAFSNLTRDHLDFHGTMDAYQAAKFGFIERAETRFRVVNLDDESGERLVEQLRAAGLFVLTVGRHVSADLRLRSLQRVGKSSHLKLSLFGRDFAAETTLVGGHNIENLLLAAGIWLQLGIAPEDLPTAIRGLRGARGRLESCESAEDDIRVLVDYAHTPDALERALEACRGERPTRILLVFGCGGDRDPGKRAPMGEIAGRGSEECWVTNDNPRSEEPALIAEAIVNGLRACDANFHVCLDRSRAIHDAIAAANAGDLVLIAGKGHEDYQIIGSQTLHFDDREVALQALEQRRAARGTRA